VIAPRRQPEPPAPKLPSEEDRRLGMRRIAAAVDAVLRRWPRGRGKHLAALLRTFADKVERKGE